MTLFSLLHGSSLSFFARVDRDTIHVILRDALFILNEAGAVLSKHRLQQDDQTEMYAAEIISTGKVVAETIGENSYEIKLFDLTSGAKAVSVESAIESAVRAQAVVPVDHWLFPKAISKDRILLNIGSRGKTPEYLIVETELSD